MIKNPIASDLSLIQKFIFLLDDFHYKVFENILENSHAQLPLKLCRNIRELLPVFNKHETLCKKIYGSYDIKQRQRFNQLSAHTFRLTKYLAINYPGYLLPNINRIQQLVNNGQVKEANLLADVLLDIAQKTEDLQTQMVCLKFFTQQHFLYKEAIKGLKLNAQLLEVIKHEQLINDIIYTMRAVFNIAAKNRNMALHEEKKKEIKKLFNHKLVTVRLLARYAIVYETYYFNPIEFTTDRIKTLLSEIDKELNNHSYIVLPFLFDIQSSVNFFKLNSTLYDITTKEGHKALEEMNRHYKQVRFWNYYLNIPEVSSITIKASQYLSKYHFLVHREDYTEHVPLAHQEEIKNLQKRCEELLAGNFEEKRYINDLITLKMLHGGLTILCGGDANVKRAIQSLEAMLIEYQQVNIAGSVDSIFALLMIGYFSRKKYSRCAETFKRYIKVIKGKPVYKDNDLDIHTYYYLSQWLLSHRKQYEEKLLKNYLTACSNEAYHSQRIAIRQLAQDFNLKL